MICTNCLSTKHRASKCPHNGVRPDERDAKVPFWAHNKVGLRAMLAHAIANDPDVTKGGSDGR